MWCHTTRNVCHWGVDRVEREIGNTQYKQHRQRHAALTSMYAWCDDDVGNGVPVVDADSKE